MFDLEKIKQGYFVKGLIQLQRNNLEAAREAFIAAGDFPDAQRQLPFILKDLGASPSEIIAPLIAAFDAGDLQALPWIIKFDGDFGYNHPDIAVFEKELQSAISDGNQSVLLGLMRIARESKEQSKYLKMMIELIKANNPNAKCELVNLIMQAEDFPAEYAELLTLQKDLPVLNGCKASFPPLPPIRSEEEFLQSADFDYLNELLNQGTSSVSSGANILKFYLDIRMRRFETFDEYINDLTRNLDSRWEDPHFLTLFAVELHANLRESELGTLKQALEPYELVDLLNELLRELPEPTDTLFDESLGVIGLERTPSNTPAEAAFQFFSKFSSPQFDEFISAFKFSPVAAAKKYSEFFSRAAKGEGEYFHPTASALEFIDRGYFDFDLVDPMLHGLVMKKLPAIIESDLEISGAFLEYLYMFEEGEAYFLDDIRRRLVNHPNAPLSIKNHFDSLV